MSIKKILAIASAKGGVGKSSIAALSALILNKDHNIGILDADIYSKAALEPGTICSNQVIERYGKSILQLTSTNQEIIDRTLLSKIIFKEKAERLWLEKLIHPILITKKKKK